MIGALALLLFGPCRATGPPDPPITDQQLQVVTHTLDALHEEIDAARTPTIAPFLLFLLSVLLPLLLAGWLLIRAERSIIGADETIRTLVRHGLSEPLVRHHLQQRARSQLPDNPPVGQLPRPRRRHRQRKRREKPG